MASDEISEGRQESRPLDATAHHNSASESASMIRLLGRAAVFLGVMSGIALLLRERLMDIELSQIWVAMGMIPWQACLLAFLFGLLSHAALAGYDLLALTRIRRRLPWPRALAGGFSGTVVSQVLGFGLITGSLARARIYRGNDIGATEAVAVSGFVAAGFFLGLSMLMTILVLIDPGAVEKATGLSGDIIRLCAALVLAAALFASVLCRGQSTEFAAGCLKLRIPDGNWLIKATALATADLVPAALCLAVLLPENALPSVAMFVTIYITGVALGHMIGSPGAVGPFEGIIFLALPSIGAEELAAGILAYRLIYYLPPFAIALWMIARAPLASRTQILSGSALTDRVAWTMDESGQAEAELVRLGDKHVFCPADGEGFVQYGIAGRIWLVIGDPVAPRRAWERLIDDLEAEAQAAGAVLSTYKATTASRAFWQDRGYRLEALGEEASILLSDWSLGGSARRELRRKYRGAEKAGVIVQRHETGEHPVQDMAVVAQSWRDIKGNEQSFSMGHWAPGFIARHVAVTAWHEDRLIAFATIWKSGDGREWMLDLMRQLPEVPNGTMHALLSEAIEMAKEEGAATFNLCMAPLSGLDAADPRTFFSRAAHHLYLHHNQRHGLQGMRRFKDIFRPDWTMRYIAVPRLTDLPEALVAAYRLVHRQTDVGEVETARTPTVRPLPPHEHPQWDQEDQDTGQRAA